MCYIIHTFWTKLIDLKLNCLLQLIIINMIVAETNMYFHSMDPLWQSRKFRFTILSLKTIPEWQHLRDKPLSPARKNKVPTWASNATNTGTTIFCRHHVQRLNCFYHFISMNHSDHKNHQNLKKKMFSRLNIKFQITRCLETLVLILNKI